MLTNELELGSLGASGASSWFQTLEGEKKAEPGVGA
jgi:hypothetical protein